MIKSDNKVISSVIDNGIITLYSEGLEIESNEYKIVNTEVNVNLPEGHILQYVTDFSDLERNIIITVVGNSPIYLRIQNLGLMPLKIQKGDVLAKLIMMSYITINKNIANRIHFIEFEEFPEFEEWLERYLTDQRCYLIYKIPANSRVKFAQILQEAQHIYGTVCQPFVKYLINMLPRPVIEKIRSIYNKEKPEIVYALNNPFEDNNSSEEFI